jgi:hypothetical protein
MGMTTFTGPITAGDILNTSGTTLGTNIANVGYVEMVQTAAITQSGGVSTTAPIVIPANSQILTITIWTTAVWVTTTTLGVGTTASATAFTTAGAVTGLGTLGQFSVTPGTSLTQIANWIDVGATDVQLAISTSTGTGTGWISVKYVQANNLTP